MIDEVSSDGAADPLLLLQLPTLLLPHPFINLMLELLFLPQHATVSAPPSQHLFASADLSLHRSVIDMSSIYHARITFTPQLLLLPLTVMLKPF